MKRVLLIGSAAIGAIALSGCVVAPYPGYGYDNGYGATAVVGVAPAVVVTPAPVVRRHRYHYGPWWR